MFWVSPPVSLGRLVQEVVREEFGSWFEVLSELPACLQGRLFGGIGLHILDMFIILDTLLGA